MAPTRTRLRRLRFFVLEKVVLPLAVIPLRGLIWTWRTRGPSAATMHEIAKVPRVILVTCHGMFLHGLAFARLWVPYGRRVVVMLSPSLDGQLLAATLERFGLDHVCATSDSRGVAGTLEFIRRVEAGDVGLIAVDGPRGPRGVVKPGVLRIAAAAHAQLVVASTAASRGITFGSWDRAHLATPFARVDLVYRLLPPSAVAADDAISQIQRAFNDAAQQLAHPAAVSVEPVA